MTQEISNKLKYETKSCLGCNNRGAVWFDDGDLGSKWVDCRVCKAKMMIVIRKDLKMKPGKIAAQSGHAVLGAYKKADKTKEAFIEWDTQEFTKIAVSVNSEEELLDIVSKAESNGVNYCLIRDAGHTVFHGVPTITCAAIGPEYGHILQEITGSLPLY